MSGGPSRSSATGRRKTGERSEACGLRAHAVSGWKAVGALEDEWRLITSRNPRLGPFQSFTWAHCWWHAIGRADGSVEPYAMVARRSDGACAGILPMMTRWTGDEAALEAFTAPWADYHDVVSLPGAAGAVLEAVLDRLSREERTSPVTLEEVSASSETARAIGTTAAWRWEVTGWCSSILLQRPGARDILFAGGEYERKYRRLGARRLAILHHVGEGLVAALPSFVEMHRRQWSGRPGLVAGFDQPGVVELYERLAHRSAPDVCPVLSELRWDARPLAFYFGFLSCDSYLGYRTTFDVEASKLSPGHVLLTLLCRDLRDRGLRVFDLMRGQYPYKQRYASYRVPQGRARLAAAAP